jgi:hypothetical protein
MLNYGVSQEKSVLYKKEKKKIRRLNIIKLKMNQRKIVLYKIEIKRLDLASDNRTTYRHSWIHCTSDNICQI